MLQYVEIISWRHFCFISSKMIFYYFNSLFIFEVCSLSFAKQVEWNSFNTIFVSSQMYPENPEEPSNRIGSINMGYDILYPTIPGFELATSSVTSANRFL